MTLITIEGDTARTTSPEGKPASLSVSRLVGKLAGPRMDSCGAILPDGTKCLVPTRDGAIVVHQTPPRVYNFKWIADGSPADYGPGTEYRSVRIALPYLIVLATFARGLRGGMCLGGWNECFFRNAPLKSLTDELFYPALLNCSRFDPPEGRPLAWICTEKLRRAEFMRLPEPAERFQGGLAALLRHLLETGFNLSSEHHELTSWFTASVEAGIDPRISSVESWEEATREDSLFVLDVPWLPTGMTLAQMLDRIFSGGAKYPLAVKSSDDLARIIFNNAGSDEAAGSGEGSGEGPEGGSGGLFDGDLEADLDGSLEDEADGDTEGESGDEAEAVPEPVVAGVVVE